ALYRLPEGAQEAALELPRPLRWSFERGVQAEGKPTGTVGGALLDRGGQVTITYPQSLAPAATPGVQESGSAKIREILPAAAGTQEYAWQAERMPMRVALGWRPHRPDLAVDALFRITWSCRQAPVRRPLQGLGRPMGRAADRTGPRPGQLARAGIARRR